MTTAAPTDASRLIAIADDDAAVRRAYALALRSAGFNALLEIADERELVERLAKAPVAVLLLDLNMPHIHGETLLTQLRGARPDLPIIVATATIDVDTAVRCIQHGAYDYLLKPIARDRLLTTIGRALEVAALRCEVDRLHERLLAGQPRRAEHFQRIITRNPAMLALFNYVEAVAASPQPILVCGETGTGKELVAEAIHACAGGSGQLISVNVAGLDDTVFSDTLFGHARGAFTGAERAREGLVAQAGGGTLFLDEIGELARESQVKLLRLIQQRTYYPLGADQPRSTDARIVVATNRELEALVRAGAFRDDLYYRLRTHRVHIPPLRERRGDIPLLVTHFVARACAAMGKAQPAIAPALFERLAGEAFPGNVRELEAIVYDAIAVQQGPVFGLDNLPLPAEPALAGAATTAPAADIATAPDELRFSERLPTLDEIERRLIKEALARSGGNQRVAAAMLGITRQALNKRLVRRRLANAQD